jgi:nitroreductase
MLLGAVEKGLGGCMLGNFDKEELNKALSLPETMSPQLIIAIGKPDEKVVLVDTSDDGSTKYYRDENDIHYVPKRKLEDILIR